MSTFALKIIAITTMLIDHITAIFVPSDTLAYLVGRIIGRMAFPIFIFLLVEGFYNTRNVKNYLKRLGIFALISEIPYDLAFYNAFFRSSGGNIKVDLPQIFSDNEVFYAVIKRFTAAQNVFFTLFIGLATIYLMSIIEKKYRNNMLYVNILNAIITLVACLVAALLGTDYSIKGVLMIVAFYLFRGSKILLLLSIFIISNEVIQAFSAMAMIPIAFYNGKKGKDIKYFFYSFYPVHLLLLFLISLIL